MRHAGTLVKHVAAVGEPIISFRDEVVAGMVQKQMEDIAAKKSVPPMSTREEFVIVMGNLGAVRGTPIMPVCRKHGAEVIAAIIGAPNTPKVKEFVLQ